MMTLRCSRRNVLLTVLVAICCFVAVDLATSVSTVYAARNLEETKKPSKTKRRGVKYYQAGTPTRAIQELDDKLDDFIVKNKGEKLTISEEEYNKGLKAEIIHGTFDIRELAKLSLAKHWPERSQPEQGEFVNILTDLLEEKALFSKEQSAAKSKSGGKYFVSYRGHRYVDAKKMRAHVRTKVVLPKENITITLNYKLRKKGNEWKIYDVIVDEASLVDNYKYQFNSIIKKHGYPELVKRMSSKLDQLKDKRGEPDTKAAEKDKQSAIDNNLASEG